MGAGAAVGELGARVADQPLAQDVAQPVVALQHPDPGLVVAALGDVVTGQPGRHGQQLPDGDAAQPRVGVGGEVVGQELPDGLVQVSQMSVLEGDADQRRGDALGHREAVMAVAGVKSVPVVRGQRGPGRVLAERVSGERLDQLFETWLFTATKPVLPAATATGKLRTPPAAASLLQRLPKTASGLRRS
jgi:hypothetical protein